MKPEPTKLTYYDFFEVYQYVKTVYQEYTTKQHSDFSDWLLDYHDVCNESFINMCSDELQDLIECKEIPVDYANIYRKYLDFFADERNELTLRASW